MSWFFYRSLILPLFYAVMTVAAYAGDTHDADHPGHTAGLCGTTWMGGVSHQELLANTARLDPGVYRMMIAAGKQPSRVISDIGDEWVFFVTNRVTKKYDSVRAVLKWEGARARIWVDRLDTSRTAVKNSILGLAKGLDTATATTSRNPNKGIIENDEEVYGPVPTKYAAEWDNKTNFLMTDIKDGYVGGFVGGYFSPSDQLDQPGSNRMNLLYIDSREGLQGGNALRALLSTLAHEFQHLIHYARNPQSDIVYNEGCSEVASILNGYKDRDNRNYMANTNVDLFNWNRDDVNQLLADYERAMTFVHYLREQYGERFLTEFAKSTASGINRINDALTKIGSPSNANEALKGFAVANYLQTYPDDPRYGYTFKLHTSGAKAARTFTGSSFPADTLIQLAPYGSSYLVFNKPQGALKFRFTSGRAFRVMAMLYRGTEVSVADLEPAMDHMFGEWGAFDKVVLAYVSLEDVQAQVAANSQFITLGVDDRSESAASLALLGSTPNPSAGPALIRFSTDVSGPVTLKVYNAQGQLVGTLIDGERFAPGEHSVSFSADDLTNGYYVARLIQGGRSVSHPLVVVK